MIDLFGLGHLAVNPPILGGVQISNFYGPDGFHPETAPQGILANTVLEALDVAYDVNIHQLRLSDQEILTVAGIPHAPGRTYFDVRPYVIFSDEHDDASSNARQGLVLDESTEALDWVFARAGDDDGLFSELFQPRFNLSRLHT